MALIGTRLADDLSQAIVFTRRAAFKAWEKKLLQPSEKNAEHTKSLVSSAITAAQNIRQVTKQYKSDEKLYRAFLEGMQYGYDDNSGWSDEVTGVKKTTNLNTILGTLTLSGENENVIAWKKTLLGKKLIAAGKVGYNTGSNLRKNVNSVVSSKSDLVNYFTAFSLEYAQPEDDQTSIGDILTDIRKADSTPRIDTASAEIDGIALNTAQSIIFFFRTHTLVEYQAFLRAFNRGYTEQNTRVIAKRGPGGQLSGRSIKQPRSSRIESLYSDIDDSQRAQTSQVKYEAAETAGEQVGVQFRQKIDSGQLVVALKLLSKYYIQEMRKFEENQTYPILTILGSILSPFFLNNVKLNVPLSVAEFQQIFGTEENLIDVAGYRSSFPPSLIRSNPNDRIDIVEQLFESSYGVYSMNRDGRAITDLVKKIINDSQGDDVYRSIPLSEQEIDLIVNHMLPRSLSMFDNEYISSPAQREINTTRACEFYSQCATVLNDREDRDAETIILTSMLVNTMSDYVRMTSSLSEIFAVYPTKREMNAQLLDFLAVFVEEKNARWLKMRIRIIKRIMHSRNLFDVVNDMIAADIAYYFKNAAMNTAAGFKKKFIEEYTMDGLSSIDNSITEASYEATILQFGMASFLHTSTSSLFNWIRVNNNTYWPADMCGMLRAVHDIIMFRYLQDEMQERTEMLEAVLFYTNTTAFTRWDLINYLAQQEKKDFSSEEYVTFSSKVNYLLESFTGTSVLQSSVPVQDDSSIIDLFPLTPDPREVPRGFDESSFFSDITQEDIDRFNNLNISTVNDDSSFSSLTDTDDGFGVNFSPNLIGASIPSASVSMTSSLIKARQKGVVIRPIDARTARSTAASSSKIDKSDIQYIGAYRDYAFGEKIGCALYSSKCKKVISLEAQEQVGELLTEYISEQYPDSDTSICASIGSSSSSSVTISTGSTNLVIDATVTYRPFLAGSGRESPHGIFFYPSYSYAQSAPVFLSASDAMRGTRLQMEYKVNREHIPGHALFNVDSYAQYKDESGETGINQSGFAACRLADLAQNKTTKLSLVVPNSEEKRKKGEIVVVVHSVSLPVNEHASVSSDKDLSKERSSIQQRIKEYIASNKRFYKLHPNCVQSVQNITVFEYACRDGIIPGSMFDSFKLAPSDESYYLQVLKFAVQRRRPDTDMESFDLNNWVQFEEDLKICIFMDVLRLYVNYCAYIRDLADGNVEGSTWSSYNVELIESFDDIRQRDAGDCEDFTKEIIKTAMEIKYNLKYSQSPAIQELHRISNMFIFASILCGVSREAMSLAQLSKGSARLHGHECAVAIPNYIFFETLRRHDASHALTTLYTEEEMNAGQGNKLFILEGTGCLFPEARDKSPKFASIQREMSSKCKKVAKRISDMVFYDPRKDSTFYKQMISILTPEFFLRTGYTGLEFLVCRVTPSGINRGVPFSLLLDIHANKDVVIVQAPSIPIDVFQAASRMDDDNFPPISLQRGSVTAEMRQTCALLTTRRPRQDEDVFQCQIRFKYMSKNRIQRLKQFAVEKQLDILCIAEPVKMSASSGECIGGYTIFMF